MERNVLHSIMLELSPQQNATIPATMGHQAHALFLNLIQQFDMALFTRLHDQAGPRPFTVSFLHNVQKEGERIFLQAGQTCALRITLFDSGEIWHALRTYFLEAGTINVQLGHVQLQLKRMLSTPSSDPTGWVRSTSWETLASLPAQHAITMHFLSPTAFSMGKREFVLVPKPNLLWESLMRVWNAHTPPDLRLERQPLSQYITEHVIVTDCKLTTATLHFPGFDQKGFFGTCTYLLQEQHSYVAQLTALAAFAYYAGVGYKTTMGMGQARAEFAESAETE